MSEAKQEEPINKQEEVKDKESPPKNNPFYDFKETSNQPKDQKVKDNEGRSKSKSQKNYRSHSSHSRSRQKQQRDYKYAKDNFSKGAPQYDRDRERQRINMPSQEDEVKDEAYFKTKLCPLFDKGGCKKGSACSFAHGEKELRGLPNFKKTRLCIPYKNGECPKTSAECKYAHGESQLRKLVYDYFPQKNYEQNRYQRNQRYEPRNDRNDRYDRDRNQRGGDRYERYDRYERNDRRYRDQRDDSRDRNRDRERDRNYPPRDREYSSRNQPPMQSGYYIPNYSMARYQLDNAYMIAPSASMGSYSQDMYGPPPPSSSISSGNPPASSSSYPSNAPQGNYSQPPLYGMNSSYEYGYGYLPHNYPPYNSSSV